MMRCAFIILMAFAVLSGGGNVITAEASAVATLTSTNFDELTSPGAWLLDFYAPWCAHCKALEPIWEDVAVEVGDKVNFGKIDCTEHKDLQARFDVKGFPTLIFKRDGEHRVYRGDRSRAALLEFVKLVSSPAVSSVTAGNLRARLDDKGVAFLFLGAPAGAEARIFEQAARRLQPAGGLQFFTTVDTDLLNRHAFKIFGVSTKKQGESVIIPSPTAVVLSKGADETRFPGPWDVQNLRTFMEAHSLPLISELRQDNFEQVTVNWTAVIVTDPQTKTHRLYLDMLQPVARDFRGKFIFVNMDGLKYDKYLSQFGLSPANFPIVFVLDYGNEQFYPPPPGVRMDNIATISEFLSDVYEGRIKPQPVGFWWNPMRLMRWFEKYLAQFSDTALIAGSVAVSLVMMGLFFFVCCWGDRASSSDDTVRKPDSVRDNALSASAKGGSSGPTVNNQASVARRRGNASRGIVEDDSEDDRQ